jgi:hypothetical protein
MFMPIDLNAAGKEELMRLQEVSEHAAERVVEHRAQMADSGVSRSLPRSKASATGPSSGYVTR